MVHFKPSPLFQIRLQDDALAMRGSRTESVGCVLRGQLVLVITEPTKFKEIKLLFQGKSKVRWVDIKGTHDEEKILYQHDWTFLLVKNKHHILKPDNYHWDFELILPGNLSETIKGCQYGSIKYTLKAVAKRHALAVNLHTKRKVTLLRNLLPSSLEYLQSAIIINTTENIEYEFSTNSTAFSLGDKVSVTMMLKSADEFKVQSVSCNLKEYVTYKIGKDQAIVPKPIRIVNENICTQQANSWSHLMEISLPNNLLYCLYDSQNDTISIKHILKLNFTMTFNSRRFFVLRASLPIIITPNGNNMNLPVYNENYLDKPYFEDDSLTLSSSVYTSSEYLREIEELNRLPSYRSIASLIPAPLSDSSLPPTYDSINGH